MNITLKKIKQPEMSHEMPLPTGPTFYIDANQMPEIKDWEVGKKYRLVVEVEQKSRNEREDMIDGSFEIVAYKHLADKKMENMDDKEFEEYSNKVVNQGHL